MYLVLFIKTIISVSFNIRLFRVFVSTMRDFNIPVQIALNQVLEANITQFCENTGEGSTDVDELRKNFRAVQEENNKLQAVVTDVTEVNKQWQKYNNDRQLYVQCLLSTIQDQQDKINKRVSQGQVEEELRAEVSMLRRQLQDKEKQYQEHVEVLEFQVKAHRDDWEAERSEKQQAVKLKEAAEQQVKQLEKHILNLNLKLQEQHCELCCGCQHPKTYRTSVHLPCTSADNKKLCLMEESHDDDHYSCSVLHISPTASGSSISGDGVTIGFNSNGLASVTSFSERSVVKSSSMPISIARPPVSVLATKSNSENNVTVRKNSVPWKAKYFEEGVATQTKDDVICPGCGQIFPPNLQIEFLDHFEVCQKCERKKFNKPRN